MRQTKNFHSIALVELIISVFFLKKFFFACFVFIHDDCIIDCRHEN